MAGTKSPSSNDRRIGQLIRLRRMECGLSQEELAARLDLTFQQVQKYEKGVNRISAGRLQDVAAILDVSAGYFYGEAGPGQTMPAALFDNLEGLPLLQAFQAITDPVLRCHAIKLVQALAEIDA